MFTHDNNSNLFKYISKLPRNAFLDDSGMNIRPYKRSLQYKTITYILILAKRAYYDRFESAKQ